MEHEELINQIVTLLEMLDGVRVLKTQPQKDVMSIDLTIEKPQALLLLTYCAEAANIQFASWTRYKPVLLKPKIILGMP